MPETNESKKPLEIERLVELAYLVVFLHGAGFGAGRFICGSRCSGRIHAAGAKASA
jgi:hypothetical protein